MTFSNLQQQGNALDPLCPHTISRPVMTQTWRDVTFAHWPVDAEDVRKLLPAGLEPDLFEGSAWVSLVGFEMDDLRLRGLPRIPTTHRFEEFNVRTYVRGSEGPGVWFCSLDVAHWLPTLVARIGFALPYDKGRVSFTRVGSSVDWFVDRTWPTRATGRLTATIDEGSVVDGELSTFLTARWRLYAATRSGRLVTAPVEHPPWKLHSATLEAVDAGVAATAGFDLQGDALVHHGMDVPVRVGRPRLLRRVKPTTTVVVWFDEDCGVCSASVRFLSQHSNDSVQWRPNRELTDPELRRRSDEALLVTGQGRVSVGVDGVAAILERSGWLGRLGAVGLRLPGIYGLAGLVYRWVAANRTRISARLGLATGCELPKR
ncbi:MAG: DUF2071 domain-containing protein [Acidimicrobiales bacterium]